MEITIKTDELYSLIKKAVREVLHEESLEFFMKNVPLVSKEEMEDIENRYGKPSPNKEVAFSETIEV
jgi:hypothetical protein